MQQADLIYGAAGLALLALVGGMAWWLRRRRRQAARRAAEIEARRHRARAAASIAKREAQRLAEEESARSAARAAEQAALTERETAARRAAQEQAAAAARQAEERQRLAREKAAEKAEAASAATAREAAARMVAQEAAARAAAQEAATRAALVTRAPAPAARRPEETLVLVADDSKVVRVKTRRLLAQHGYRVVLAEDGEQAAQLLDVELPAVLITDVEMPGMDGFALTRHVRRHPLAARIPVIMITSADDRLKDAAAEAGVTLVLGKPYPEADLIACIERSQSAVAG